MIKNRNCDVASLHCRALIEFETSIKLVMLIANVHLLLGVASSNQMPCYRSFTSFLSCMLSGRSEETKRIRNLMVC
jgi:hypothetical protein